MANGCAWEVLRSIRIYIELVIARCTCTQSEEPLFPHRKGHIGRNKPGNRQFEETDNSANFLAFSKPFASCFVDELSVGIISRQI